MSIRGLIFDLDGTLVDSGLDFEQMRSEMGLAAGAPLLEALARLSAAEAERCHAILERHECAGAERAVLMPGVAEFLTEAAARGLRCAVFTRNGRQVAQRTLERLGLQFETIVAREDAPIKPDPAGIWTICRSWGLSPDEVAMVGDYRFDIIAGRQAGVKTVCYAARRSAQEVETWGADFCLACFSAPEKFWQWAAGEKRDIGSAPYETSA